MANRGADDVPNGHDPALEDLALILDTPLIPAYLDGEVMITNNVHAISTHYLGAADF